MSTALGEQVVELERRWSELGALERYVLAKLSEPGRSGPEARAGRLRAAFDEIVGGKGPALSHLDARGDAHMVDVSDKRVSVRTAEARAFVAMRPETLQLLVSEKAPKGDVLAAARIAGIQAAKRTPELIPLCHAIALTGVEVELEPSSEPPGVRVLATARALDRTGVEMEALVAASIASLTLYDMLKSADRAMTIERVELVRKSGGRSGDYRKPGT